MATSEESTIGVCTEIFRYASQQQVCPPVLAVLSAVEVVSPSCCVFLRTRKWKRKKAFGEKEAANVNQFKNSARTKLSEMILW